jgi:transitional endoplasmic reticulum ATPase
MAEAATLGDQKIARLQVAGSRQEESGHGIARISRAVMGRLGVAEGDVIEIIGKRSTAARAVLPIPRMKVSN